MGKVSASLTPVKFDTCHLVNFFDIFLCLKFYEIYLHKYRFLYYFIFQNIKNNLKISDRNRSVRKRVKRESQGYETIRRSIFFFTERRPLSANGAPELDSSSTFGKSRWAAAFATCTLLTYNCLLTLCWTLLQCVDVRFCRFFIVFHDLKSVFLYSLSPLKWKIKSNHDQFKNNEMRK